MSWVFSRPELLWDTGPLEEGSSERLSPHAQLVPAMEKYERSRATLIPRKSGALSTFSGGEKGSHAGPMLQKRRLLYSHSGRMGVGWDKGVVIQTFWK